MYMHQTSMGKWPHREINEAEGNIGDSGAARSDPAVDFFLPPPRCRSQHQLGSIQLGWRREN